MSTGEFRQLLSTVPAGVTIVTARESAGEPVGLTVTAFSAVSLHPPQVLVGIDTTSNTLPAMRHTGTFTVNFLARGAHQWARRFAAKSAEKFDKGSWQHAARAGYGPVLAHHSYGYLLCEIVHEVEAGDHWILIGRVEQAQLGAGHDPLLYCQRTFASWTQCGPKLHPE